jgi:uncharacterized membrane protein YgcG
VIAASTLQPAEAIGWEDRVGTLGVGREADVTVMEAAACDIMLEDSNSQLRHVTTRLRTTHCWRAGQAVEVTRPEDLSVFPNPVEIAAHVSSWKVAVYRDETPPQGFDPDEKSDVELFMEGDLAAAAQKQLSSSGRKISAASPGGGGGVSSSGASGGGGSSIGQYCMSARQWPGGPEIGVDDTCCGTAGMVRELIDYSPIRL